MDRRIDTEEIGDKIRRGLNWYWRQLADQSYDEAAMNKAAIENLLQEAFKSIEEEIIGEISYE